MSGEERDVLGKEKIIGVETMSLEERMYHLLIVSSAATFTSSLQGFLPSASFEKIETAQSVSQARRMILERAYDFVIVNSPVCNDVGVRFATDASSGRGTIVLLLVRNELYSEVYPRAARQGVFVLPKPTSRQSLLQALDWMICARERLRKLENKTVTIEEKMEEIRLVNRAKWVLIEQLKMTEPDAHRYIEKQAMDRCISKREIATEIIRTY